MDHLRLMYRGCWKQLGDPHLVVLLRDRCSCTRDRAFPMASGSLYLPTTFFSPKRDGFSHVHCFLSHCRHKPGVFLSPAPTRAYSHFWGVHSPVEGFSPWFATIPSHLPPLPSPDTRARLLLTSELPCLQSNGDWETLQRHQHHLFPEAQAVHGLDT